MPNTVYAAPREPGAGHRPTGGRFWLVLVAAVLVAAGASQTIGALRGGADQSRQAATSVAMLDAGINRQAALRWQALREASDRAGIAGAIAEAGADIEQTLTALARVERASFGLRDLASGVVAYNRALEDQIRTLAVDPTRAAELGRTTVDPAFRSFRSARDTAAGQLAASAETSGRAADLGTLFALMSGAILVSLVFRKWERVRRRSAWEAGARTGVEQSEARFRSLVQHSSDLVIVVEPDGRIAYTSPSVTQLLGDDTKVGVPISDLVHPDDIPAVERALAPLDGPGAGRPTEWRMRNPSGPWQTYEYVVSPGRDALRGRLVLNGRDVTERKNLEERLRHQAQHDPLTGLANRALLRESLQRAAARSRRHGTTMALLMLDLDGFKAVNDTFGHGAGDELLVGIAQRLSNAVRADALVARISGDEFAVLVEDLDRPEAADAIALRLVEGMRAPFQLREHAVAASFSVGVALAIAGEPSVDVLLRQADLAMYAAKGREPGSWVRHESYVEDVAPVARAS